MTDATVFFFRDNTAPLRELTDNEKRKIQIASRKKTTGARAERGVRISLAPRRGSVDGAAAEASAGAAASDGVVAVGAGIEGMAL